MREPGSQPLRVLCVPGRDSTSGYKGPAAPSKLRPRASVGQCRVMEAFSSTFSQLDPPSKVSKLHVCFRPSAPSSFPKVERKKKCSIWLFSGFTVDRSAPPPKGQAGQARSWTGWLIPPPDVSAHAFFFFPRSAKKGTSRKTHENAFTTCAPTQRRLRAAPQRPEVAEEGARNSTRHDRAPLLIFRAVTTKERAPPARLGSTGHPCFF